MSLVRELWEFLKVRKKFRLARNLLVLVILSGFICLAASAPAFMPFLQPF